MKSQANITACLFCLKMPTRIPIASSGTTYAVAARKLVPTSELVKGEFENHFGYKHPMRPSSIRPEDRLRSSSLPAM